MIQQCQFWDYTPEELKAASWKKYLYIQIMAALFMVAKG